MTGEDLATRLLAAEFVIRLCETIGPAQVTEADRLNAARPPPSECASHEFCAANQVMERAFATIHRRYPQHAGDCAPDTRRCKAAWQLARQTGFSKLLDQHKPSGQRWRIVITDAQGDRHMHGEGTFASSEGASQWIQRAGLRAAHPGCTFEVEPDILACLSRHKPGRPA